MSEEQKDQHKPRDESRYACYGRTHASERAMLLDFLEEYRCAEDFAAEYIGQWIDISGRDYVKGGLRTIH
jgi:hypothetical protein